MSRAPGGVHGPTLPRRRIARELKKLREDRGLSLEDVARGTDVSTSTLSRLENAQGSANTLTMRALVAFYKLDNTEPGWRLLRWAKDGRKQGWWQRYPDAAVENTSLYVAYESQASTAKLYSIPFMPILLQTAEYSRALAKAFHPQYGEDEVERLVDFRRQRQRVLEASSDKSALDLRVILHESCLLQVVDSYEVMHDQLQHILDTMADTEKKVTVQVLSLNSQPHTASRCVWAHFEYEDELDPDITLLETHIGFIMPLEEPDEVRKSAEQFEELSALALTPTESTELIEQLMKLRYSMPLPGALELH